MDVRTEEGFWTRGMLRGPGALESEGTDSAGCKGFAWWKDTWRASLDAVDAEGAVECLRRKMDCGPVGVVGGGD